MKFIKFVSAKNVWDAAKRVFAVRAPEGHVLVVHVEEPLGELKEPLDIQLLTGHEKHISLIQRYKRTLGVDLQSFVGASIPPRDEVMKAIREYHRRIWEEGEASREGEDVSMGRLLGSRRAEEEYHPLAGAIYDLGTMAEKQYAHGIVPLWSGADVEYMALTETLQRPKLPSAGALSFSVSGGRVHLSALYRQLEIPKALAVLCALGVLLGLGVHLANGVRAELRGDVEPTIFRGLLPEMRPPEPVATDLEAGSITLLAAHSRWPRKIKRTEFRRAMGVT